MKKSLFEQVILYDYRYIIGYALLVVAALYGLFWRLGTLLPGLSNYEAEYVTGFGQEAASLGQNPLYWPHKLLSQVSVEWLGSTELAFRLPSAMLALIGLVAFFFIIRHRFKSKVAVASVLLLAASSWWLSSARLARPEILLPVAMIVIALLARKCVESRGGPWLLALGLAIGASFYIPLMPYVLLIGTAVSYSVIRKLAGEFSRKWLSAFLSILILALVPLLIAIFNDPPLGRQLLALPADFPGLDQYLANIKDIVASVFWSARESGALNLGTLPYLDVFTVAMFILGFYYLDHEISRGLTQFLLLGLVALLLLLGINPQPGHIIVLIPFIYTMVAAGIVMLFSQWYEIFPRNPIARMTVFLPTVLLLAAVVWYHHTRYFTALPNSPQAVETFTPLSSSIHEFLDIAGRDNEAVILATSEEMAVASAAVKAYPEVQVTSVASAAIAQPNLAITRAAFAQLDPESLKLADRSELKSLNSPYESIPVVMWYTTTD